MLIEIEKTLRSHPFIPPTFLQNVHIQHYFPLLIPYFRTQLPLPEKKLISLPDGSQIAVFCLFQTEKEKHPTVVIIDGFGSSSDGYFSKRMKYKAYHAGFNVILLNQRAQSGTMHLTKSLYTGPLEDDVNIALNEFVKWGLDKVYLAGISYGGYLVLSALIKSKKLYPQKISGAVIFSPILNMDYVKHLDRHPYYGKIILKGMKNLVKKRAKIDPPGTWDLHVLKKIPSVLEWYRTYMHNWGYPEKFSSFEDYHQKSDIQPLLKEINVPTLIINSHDDPISPSYPFEKITNPHIITLLSKYGGHGTFFTTKPLYGDLDGHWAQNRAMEFIRLLEEQDSK